MTKVQNMYQIYLAMKIIGGQTKKLNAIRMWSNVDTHGKVSIQHSVTNMTMSI